MDGYTPKLTIKRWGREQEREILETWRKEKLYRFDPDSGKPVFVIDTPPPYPGPFWHIGAAASYTFQDMIARSRRMMGYEVLYPIGFDRNGIPVELYVEKYEGTSMWEMDREEFVEKCAHALDEYVQRMKSIMESLLFSGDFENYYETDREDYRILTQQTFIELWKKGLIYEDLRPNNWCPHCRTTIADAEVEYKEKEGELYHIRFPLADGGEIVIATTRPELLGACDAVIVHPEDERYRGLHGKEVIVPLYGKRVKIIAHREANPEFGTGAVMICSYGDITDVRLFRELRLKPTILIDTEGRMTEAAGPYKGLKVGEARKRIVEDLKKEGYLVKTERIVHKVPVHDKCKHEIEIIPMKEYYLRQTEFLEALKKHAEEMRWYPEKYKQNLIQWIDSVTVDWPISRRRYYATEIPLWYCKKCGYTYVPEGGRYYRPWKEDPGVSCPKCGARDWQGETRVLDTWFDSSISILYITKYRKDPEFFEKTFVRGEKLRPQGYDIIRTWLYYTLLRVHQLLGKKAFDHVFINGMGLDEKGRKMSKSLGNVIYPEDIIEKYGADAVRFWIAMESKIGENYRIVPGHLEGARRFITKLLNIARFISQFPQEGEITKPTDRWILEVWEETKKRVLDYYRDMDFHGVAQEMYSFLWDTFASHYIEMVKARARDGDPSAHATLHTVLREALLLLAPIVPGITDYVYRELYRESVHVQSFPETRETEKRYAELTERIKEFNSTVWKYKKEHNMRLRDPVSMEIPEELKEFAEDLRRCHNITQP